MILQERSLEDEIDAYSENNASADLQSEFSKLFYPVGTIYMSYDSTSPASLFGGSWAAITDKMLLGAGSTYTAGTTGGTAGIRKFTHKHSAADIRAKVGAGYGDAASLNHVLKAITTTYTTAYTLDADSSVTVSTAFSHYTPVVGDTDNYTIRFSSEPFYLAVYIWERVA